MTMKEFAGVENVDTTTRGLDVEPGTYPEAEIASLRYHQGLAGDSGVKIEYLIAGCARTQYISLKKDPRYSINYGVRRVKTLIAAIKGLRAGDPRANEISEAEIESYLGPAQAGRGARVHLEVTPGRPNPKRPGSFYPEILVSPSSTAAPTPPAPAPAPETETWYDFPEGDARRGTAQYSRSGAVRAV